MFVPGSVALTAATVIAPLAEAASGLIVSESVAYSLTEKEPALPFLLAMYLINGEAVPNTDVYKRQASGSPNILYQWQDSIAAGVWANVSEAGGTTAGFTTDPLTTTTWYRVFVAATEAGCEDIFSTFVAVNVSPDIAISAQPVGGSICTGGNFDLNVVASGSPSIPVSYTHLMPTKAVVKMCTPVRSQ